MAYTCNLLLRTLPAIKHELNPPDEEQQVILDMPRPKRDLPEDPERAFYKSMARRCTPVASHSNTDSDSGASAGVSTPGSPISISDKST
jgi:hypothetical protein